MPAAVIYSVALHPRWRAAAATGGPGGELRMIAALGWGLERLGVDAVAIGTLRSFAWHRLAGRARRTATTYFVDPWALELACRYRLLGLRDVPRLRILEWFGTPPSRIPVEPPGIVATQYLLPYPDDHGWNRWLGYLLEDDSGPLTGDRAAVAQRVRTGIGAGRRQGVVWAKEMRYLEGPGAAIVSALAKVCPLHTTISTTRGYRPGALPAGVTNHGALEPASWRALLRDASFVVGLGDPILGPTALEALAEGCVYLNPRYGSPRPINGIPELTVASQHPYAARIGPPFVRTFDPQSPESAVEAAQASLCAADREARLAAADSRSPLVEALTAFTVAPYLSRLRLAMA